MTKQSFSSSKHYSTETNCGNNIVLRHRCRQKDTGIHFPQQ